MITLAKKFIEFEKFLKFKFRFIVLFLLKIVFLNFLFIKFFISNSKSFLEYFLQLNGYM